jgi:hypothetical protein
MQESVAVKSRQFRDRQVYVVVTQFWISYKNLCCRVKSMLKLSFKKPEVISFEITHLWSTNAFNWKDNYSPRFSSLFALKILVLNFLEVFRYSTVLPVYYKNKIIFIVY